MHADIYLSVQTRRAGKVKGEAVAPDHEGEIAIRSWNWGASSNTPQGASQPTSRRSYRHLVLVKSIDSASTALLNALATNDEVREAKLTMRKAGDGQQDYFFLTLNAARVVGLDLETGESGETLERVTLAFSKVQIEYRPQQSTGGRGASFTFNDDVLPT